MAPSRLRRILRFDRLADDPAPDWATLAVESGFGDQSHLVREFHALAGVTPTTYLRTRLPGGEHLDASGTG